MYTINEAIDMLAAKGITSSIQVLRRWLRNGVIQGECTSNRKEGWRINPDELARFIASRNHDYKTSRLEDEVLQLQAEIDRLTAKLNMLHKSNVTSSNIGEETLYDPVNLSERWERTVSIQFSDVPADLVTEAHAILIRNLPKTEIIKRYQSPFTGKRYGSMDKVIYEAIPYVIESVINRKKQREESTKRRQAESGGRYLDQI